MGRHRPRVRYDDARWLHAYEDEVIIAVLQAAGGSATASGLMFAYPDRFNGPYLRKALRRLYLQRRLQRRLQRVGAVVVQTYSVQ